MAEDVRSYTETRGTLEHVEMQNVTLSIPRSVLKKVKIAAARRDTSISALMTAALTEIADEDGGRELAIERMKEQMTRGFDLGTGGNVTWTREELHERGA